MWSNLSNLQTKFNSFTHQKAATNSDTNTATTTTTAVMQNTAETSAKTKEFFTNIYTKTQKDLTKLTTELSSKLNLDQLRAQNRYIRDPSQPVDTEALRDLGVLYLTDRVIICSHPHSQSNSNIHLTAQRKLAALSHLLEKRHSSDKYMIWNLSELEYDTDLLNNQVLSYKFPGSPAPPLGLLLRIIMSLQNWLKADPQNVAVVHCLTGRGRTSTVIAAFWTWIGECNLTSTNSALEYISYCQNIPLEMLTIPSQRRYLTYFGNLLDGVRPHRERIVLKRIVISDSPGFEEIFDPNATSFAENGNATKKGCSPYLQLFKMGQLLFSASSSPSQGNEDTENEKDEEVPFCESGHSITFTVNTILSGDILVRGRHLAANGERVSLFRLAFHTGYILPPKVVRFTKDELDGACQDKRFGDNFYIDLVFESIDGVDQKVLEDASKVLAISGDGMDDASLQQSESDFTEAIEQRRKQMSLDNTAADSKPCLVGKTIGRIRNRSKKIANSKEEPDKSGKKAIIVNKNEEAFSIGFWEAAEPQKIEEREVVEKQSSTKSDEKKPDELMDALSALDGESFEEEEAQNVSGLTNDDGGVESKLDALMEELGDLDEEFEHLMEGTGGLDLGNSDGKDDVNDSDVDDLMAALGELDEEEN